MKKIVLSQTCQGGVLQDLLRQSAPFRAEYDCLFVPNYAIVDGKAVNCSAQALEAELADCNLLIYHDVELYDFAQLIALLPAGARAIRIPYVTSTIYWPSFDYAHPCWLAPQSTTALIPWPCRILNGLIAGLGDKGKALRRYLDLDMADCLDLEANFAAQIAYLRRAEAGTIFSVADLVERQFAASQLFHIINHPALDIFVNITNTILNYLGFPALDARRSGDPFGIHQLPVHPSVAAHYHLRWYDPARKYRFLDREFDFEEFVAFYIEVHVAKYGYALFPPPPAKKRLWSRFRRTVFGGRS